MAALFRLAVLAPALLLISCGRPSSDLSDLRARMVTLPNGQKIRAEVAMTPVQMQRGMMFRDSLPRGQGMLFIHARPDYYGYWMFQVKIPLDIIWMDSNRRIVEISANTPPCPGRASECPSYGGKEMAQYILELGGGEAARLGLQVGSVLSF
ncbi:MAG: DUF192 domain-containing protein [Bryobacterales bacterium]|nr:DUF192 domain-containing protein [Bryobacterales bacterium]